MQDSVFICILKREALVTARYQYYKYFASRKKKSLKSTLVKHFCDAVFFFYMYPVFHFYCTSG